MEHMEDISLDPLHPLKKPFEDVAVIVCLVGVAKCMVNGLIPNHTTDRPAKRE